MPAASGSMVKTGMTSVFQAASGVTMLRILSGLFFSKATQGGRQHDGQVADDAQMYGGLATEVVAVETIRRHLEGVVNAAVVGCNNAKAESINAHIQQLKRRAAIVEWDACEMRSCFIWAGWVCIPKACHHGNGKASFRLRFLQSCNRSEEWVRKRFRWL